MNTVLRAANKEIDSIIRAIQKQEGWGLSRKKNHFRATNPDGDIYIISTTPNHRGTIDRIRRELRKKLGADFL